MSKPTNQGDELVIHDVYAYLRVHDTAAAIDFYSRAFGAKELAKRRRLFAARPWPAEQRP